MGEDNQILEVTYGKFACRLEGFEDSVETMKQVVSFFHELSGHVQFMDTALLAPEMDTLAQLTEEQTGQIVDVAADDEKLSLRVRPEAEDADVIATDDAVESDFAEDAAIEDAAAAVVDPIKAEEEAAEELSSVAEKLQRMRAAAERKIPAASDDFAEDLADAATIAPAANPLSQRLSELVKRTAESEQDRTDETADVADEHVEEPEVEDQPEIEAADFVEEGVAENGDAMDAEDINVFSDFSDDVAEEQVLEEGTVADEAVAEETEAEADEADVMEEIAAEEATSQEEDVADTQDVEPVEASDDVAETDSDASEEETSEASTDIAASDEDDMDLAADDLSDDEELEKFMAEEDAAPDTLILGPDDAGQVAEDTAEEVVASDAEATDGAESEDAAEGDAPLVLTTEDEVAEENDDYNDDDEFDLEKEVAKVEAEIAARKGNEFARRGLPRHVEDAMSRIMSQTDQHLNQPENRRHRDAFAQLKAAVAATEAARQLGDSGAEKRDPDEVYKDDLGAHDADERINSKITPPLKLVKSQEVTPETDEKAAAAPETEKTEDTSAASARLREIATQIETDAPQKTGGFPEFMASHGAIDLSDQLEAAAAYICYVDGEADFSRPQLMKIVQSASNTEISREDGLRSFGRLLRQSRLVKQANGRFQVAENTQYRPDGHQAARG